MGNTDNSLESTLEGIDLGLKVAETAINHLEEGRLELQRRRSEIYLQLAQEDPEALAVSDSCSDQGSLNTKNRRLIAVIYYVVRELEPIKPEELYSHFPDEDSREVQETLSTLIDRGYLRVDKGWNLKVQR